MTELAIQQLITLIQDQKKDMAEIKGQLNDLSQDRHKTKQELASLKNELSTYLGKQMLRSRSSSFGEGFMEDKSHLEGKIILKIPNDCSKKEITSPRSSPRSSTGSQIKRGSCLGVVLPQPTN